MAKFSLIAEELRIRASTSLLLLNDIDRGIFTLDSSARACDILTIYYHLSEICSESQRNKLDNLVLDYLRLRHIQIEDTEIDTEEKLNKKILFNLYFLVMMENVENTTQDEFRYLIDNLRQDINATCLIGNTAIIWSVANSNFENFHKLFEAMDSLSFSLEQIDAHCLNYCRGSALFLASAKGEEHRDSSVINPQPDDEKMDSVIITLLKHGASVLDACDNEKHHTPLDLMVMRRSTEMFKLMLEYLPDPLNIEQIEHLDMLLNQTTYTEMTIAMSTYSSDVCTIPKESDWENQLSEMQASLDSLRYACPVMR